MADSRMKKDEDLSIILKKWENTFLEISLWVLKYGKEFWFFGNETAKSLEYTEPKKAIQDHIDFEDKKSIEKLLGKNYKNILIESQNLSVNEKPLLVNFLHKLHPNYTVIKEVGLYSLCVKSRKPKAKPFQKWIFNATKTIRETGVYVLPGGPVENPLDLVAKVSTFEEEIETLRKKIHTLKDQGKVKTCDKETQTNQRDKDTKDTLKKLKNKIEKSIKKIEFDLEKSLKEVSSSRSSSSPRYSTDSD